MAISLVLCESTEEVIDPIFWSSASFNIPNLKMFSVVLEKSRDLVTYLENMSTDDPSGHVEGQYRFLISS